MSEFLRTNWHSPDVRKAVDYLAKDLGFNDAAGWFAESVPAQTLPEEPVGDADRATDKIDELKEQKLVEQEVERLMDADVKSTGLKELQGLIWAVGYKQGLLSSHVFDDVAPALKNWKEAGVDIRIFSSGSVTAQKVFLQNTIHGALSEYLSGHYDTTTGPKREPESYLAIASDARFEPAQILFLSDIEAELKAASAAGFKVALVVRPGNAPAEGDDFATVESFEQISVISQ